MRNRAQATAQYVGRVHRALSTSILLFFSLQFFFINTFFCFGQFADSLAAKTAEQTVFAPIATPPLIGSIIVLGNRQTKEEIILREMTLTIGDTVSEGAIEYCKNRIYSLGLFNKVDIRYLPMDTTTLFVTVDERWFIYPVPMIGIVDRDFSKWFYGLGVKHENLTGRNEKLFAGFVLGYNPWITVDYSDPWILGDLQMFSSTTLSYSHVENKSTISRAGGENFHERHYGVAQTIGKRYDQYRRTWFSTGFRYVEVSEKKNGRTASEDGIDRYLFVGIGMSHDTRDLAEYPTSGILGRASVTRFGFGEGELDYTSYNLDVRKYTLLPMNISIAVRGFVRLSVGSNVPNYQHNFYGFGDRLRGHFEEEVEGDHIFGSTAEVRIPIVQSWYVHMPQIPIPQFATWRFGLYAALFADAGRVWNRGEVFTWNNMPSSIGAGIHLLLPYSAVLRFEYAWNELGRGEFIFDLGSSF